jgi:hypothetical protein
MEKEKKEVMVKAEKPDTSVESFIAQAIAQNVPVETLERLFALREKVKAEQGSEAFTRALAAFQSTCPVIKKTKKVLNKDGTVRYMFAPLDSIIDQIRTSLSKNEISYTWDVVQKDGHMVVTCTATHVLGHSKTSTFAIPIDTEGYMTQPQKYASAQTFAKRYTLCNVLGISTGDEDDDSLSSGKEADAKSIKSKIVFRLRALGKKVDTKENTEKEVLALTQLELKPENFEEIAARLQVLIDEKNADSSIQ